MKTLICAILLALSFAANADHHRTHAVWNLTRVISQTTVAENSVTAFRNSPYIVPSRWNAVQADGFLGRCLGFLGETKADAQYMKELLLNPEMEPMLLIGMRRLLNKPWKNVMDLSTVEQVIPATPLTPDSDLYRMGRCHHLLSFFVEDNANVDLSAAIRRVKSTWEYLDFTLWHINDAIIEELYTPRAFAVDPQ